LIDFFLQIIQFLNTSSMTSNDAFDDGKADTGVFKLVDGM